MARLPADQGDADAWGGILNTYLSVAHNADGTPKVSALTAALDTTYAAKTPASLSPSDYGTVGGADDTAAVQAAITACPAGGRVVLSRMHNVTSVTAKEGVTLEGAGVAFGATSQCGLNGTDTGLDVVVTPTPGGTHVSNINLRHMRVTGGRRGFATYRGIIRSSWEDVEFSGAADAGWYQEGWSERNRFERVIFRSNAYGMRIANVLSDTQNYIDKTSFIDCQWDANTINGLKWEAALGHNCTFNNPIITTNGQHGAIFNGQFRSFVFVNLNTEANGGSGAGPARTTGSITSGSPTLTLASGTGYTNGNTVTVTGAGASGAALTAVVTNVAGDVLTLDTNAGTTVAAADVTNAIYSDVTFLETIGVPGRFTFIGGLLPMSSNSKIKWSLDALHIFDVTMVGVVASVAIYDPLLAVTRIGGSATIRRSGVSVAGTTGPDVQVFTTAGTWTKPPTGTMTQLVAIGAGGGGGGGRRGAAGTVRCGGGGGAASARGVATVPTSTLGSTVSVAVGAAGTAGAGATADDTNGSGGGAGGQSNFGSHIKGLGATGGGGGTNAAGTAGTAANGAFAGANGGAASGSGGAGGAGGTANANSGGGGAGGGISTGDAAAAGGAASAMNAVGLAAPAGGAATGANGGAGSNAPTGSGLPGSGGGGGGGNTGGAGGNGGVGGNYGGGGGGGGASVNGSSAGTGGVGGPGIVVAITW